MKTIGKIMWEFLKILYYQCAGLGMIVIFAVLMSYFDKDSDEEVN